MLLRQKRLHRGLSFRPGTGCRPRALRRRGPPAHEIAQLANAGYGPCSKTLARYEERLARALAGVINILDPDVIVLGGGLSNIASLYENVPRLWARYVFSDRVDTHLKAPVHRDSSGVRGAAWLWNTP